MSKTSERAAVLDRLWEEHLRANFPDRLRGAEPAGVEMVLLDAAIAGCVSTWQDNGGHLDDELLRILRKRIADLDQVLPLLTDTEELRYCWRLHRLAVHAADSGARLY
ncbi:hypothetical protein [Nocardia sp. NPDC057030]|uniref:hypothetical protein n=1 Tax=unclassified Nocardia TaxID=2637762 RepID=UPI00362D476D